MPSAVISHTVAGVASWAEFGTAAPELEQICRPRIEGPALILLGTLRRDGSPRISPVEPDIVDGDLLLGMMWRSTKALDLERDPRCVVHSVVNDRNGTEGDVKVRGRAVEVENPARREAYADALEARTNWRPKDPFHLFALAIEAVAHVIVEDGQMVIRSWAPGSAVRRRIREG